MVDGDESLYYPDEELDPNLRKGTPLQKSFEKVDVLSDSPIGFPYRIRQWKC